MRKIFFKPEVGSPKSEVVSQGPYSDSYRHRGRKPALPYGLLTIVYGRTTRYGLSTMVYGLLTTLLFTLTAKAQSIGPLTLSAPGTTGSYSSTTSITLGPGFSSNGTFSASIKAVTIPVDCIPLTTTPTLNQNYVITNTPRIAGITNVNMLTGLGTCALNQSIQYVDGLGRPIQTIQVMASPAGNDMVAPQAYDQYGREITKYLPYTPTTGTPGSFRPNAVSNDQGAFYNAPPVGVTAIGNPYAQTNFDNSPLDRPVEQGAPGAAWQLSTSGVTGSGHTVKMVYTLNNATAFSSDSVNGRQAALYYTVINSDMSQTLVPNGYYNANALTVTISKDENWQSGRAGTVEEYKDIDGHVVLKRVYNYIGGANPIQMLSTYYVYDDLGRLAFVLPPSCGADGAGTISSATLNNLCYQYQYDERGRPMAKKIPGKGWEYTVFNTMDQPVATQDANEQAQNQWIFTKYDGQQRPVMTGIWNNGGTVPNRATLQATLTAITTNLYETSLTTGNGYTNVAWPTANVTATLSINYYDNYNAPGLPAAYSAPATANLATRGEVTASLTAVLNTPANQLWKVNYYDNWGRSAEAYAQHYLGGVLSSSNYDAVTTTYNFTNAPTTVIRKHWNTASTSYPLVTIANTYIYDHEGRKLKSWEQITNGNSSPTTKTLLSQTVYNEVGQVMDKQLHSTDSVTFYQNIAYNYNEPGWLTNSSAPLFSMQLLYNTAAAGKQYNGNIAYQSWVNSILSDNYTYTYDKLNRLTGGISADNYGETGITYDAEGNITALNRYQNGTATPIDQLTYVYNNTNQLQTLTDNSGSNTGVINGVTSFVGDYDANGNLTTDPSKPIGTINTTYNLLNLPMNITGAKAITYTYDATGNKLRRVSTGTGNTDYINGIEYDSGALNFIQTEEGRAVVNGSSYTYYYDLGDNLGNTRVTFTNGGYAQVDDYYPFGMEISRWVSGTKDYYLYNKKELQGELAEYDYGARFYDPVIARWNTIDPMAELSRRWSPYNYVENNPIRLTDPDGMYYEESTASASIAADEARWADEKQGFEDAKNPTTSYAAGSSDPVLDAKVVKAETLAKNPNYSINESGELVRNTLDVISLLRDLLSLPALLLLPQPMADENGPRSNISDEQQNRADDQYDLNHYSPQSVPTAQDEDPGRKYLTYIKVKINDDGTESVYSGRTSGGVNESDAAILKRRDANHHMTGYGPAIKDESSTNRLAIRGREQQLIDHFGGARSDGGTSGNAIRGVRKMHPLGWLYHIVATLKFGQLHAYTGN